MGRKRKDKMKQDRATKIWSFPVYDPKTGRSTWKSAKTTVEADAQRIYDQHRDNSRWMTERGADMTVSTSRILWAEWHDPNASHDGVFGYANRWDEMKHLWGHRRWSDPQLPKDIHQWRNDLRDGKKMFNGQPLRVMKGKNRSQIRDGKLAPNSVNMYVGDLITYLNFVANPRDEGDTPLFPSKLAPKLFKLKIDKRTRSKRPSIDLKLEDEQVAALKRIAAEERIASGEKRYSVDERLIWMILHGGGQRIHRVIALRWEKNISLKKKVINFADIIGVTNSYNKTANPAFPIDEDEEFLAFLRKCWAERLPGNTDNYYLDTLHHRSTMRSRIYRLFALIGLDYGGSHNLRKTVATKAGNEAHVVIGTSMQNAQDRYVKTDIDRTRQAAKRVRYDTQVDPDEPATNVTTLGRPGKGQ